MTDPRTHDLAELVINHSCGLKPGESVLIEAVSAPREPVIALIRAARLAGATPLVSLKDDRIIRELCLSYDERGVKLMAECERHALSKVDAFVGLRAPANVHELADVPADKLKNVLRHYMQPVHWEQRNRTTKWVTLRWPTPAMAQRAGMSTEAFEEFFFSTCLVDYVKMAMVMEPLVHLMQQTDRVQVVGPGLTDLTFSIKGMAPHKDAGQHNVPDGEVATAPIIDSANGVIQFNVPTVYYNATFDNVLLELVDGNVVRAESDRSLVLDEMLDQDDGAKRLGEFAFGVNPRITQPIRDILFDEKMAGSIHLALGNAYPRCDNGNRSAIHWDLILSQTPEFGGGEIYFDGTLIRKDGLFVPPELMGLNPENLC